MKYALLIAAAAILSVLFFQLVRFRVSWVMHFYVLWMAFVAVFACVVNKYFQDTQMDYLLAYRVCVGIEVLASLYIAGQFALSLGWDGFSLLGVSIALGMVFVGIIRHRLPETPQARTMLLVGFGYCVAGLLALGSLVEQCSTFQHAIRFWFCISWLADSSYHFMECIGIQRNRAMWESLDNWLSATLRIVVVTGLLLSLRGQAEMGHQHAEDQSPAEEWVCYGN